MIFLILNFLRALVVFIKALLNATYKINPIDYSHKTVAHYNTYHTSITEWSILKPLITVLRTWYILPVHYISVQYSHSNSTPYMDTPNCPVMVTADHAMCCGHLASEIRNLLPNHSLAVLHWKTQMTCSIFGPYSRPYITIVSVL